MWKEFMTINTNQTSSKEIHLVPRTPLHTPPPEKPKPKLARKTMVETPGPKELRVQSAKHLTKVVGEARDRQSRSNAVEPYANYGGEPEHVFSAGVITIVRRMNQQPGSVEQWRYYAGAFQIAYMRVQNGFHVYASIGDAHCLEGDHFDELEDAHSFLEYQLTANGMKIGKGK